MRSFKKGEVLRYLGYSGQEIPSEINETINHYMSHITSLCRPKYTYIVSDTTVYKDYIILEGTSLKLFGNDILRHLQGAKKCVTLACTLGAEFDRELMKLQAKSMTDAVIFDAIGTAYIEGLADECEEKILAPFLAGGFFSNFRFSAGYGDLSITLQKDIITCLDAPKKIGLTVTDSGILLPQKSITAFIGVFDSPQQKPKSKCENCSKKDTCFMRKDGKCL